MEQQGSWNWKLKGLETVMQAIPRQKNCWVWIGNCEIKLFFLFKWIGWLARNKEITVIEECAAQSDISTVFQWEYWQGKRRRRKGFVHGCPLHEQSVVGEWKGKVLHRDTLRCHLKWKREDLKGIKVHTTPFSAFLAKASWRGVEKEMLL